jgi:hypothetical protein
LSRLETLRAGGKQVSEGDKRKVDEMYEKNRKLWKTRKKMCKDIVDTISEGIGKKPKAFMVGTLCIFVLHIHGLVQLTNTRFVLLGRA